MRVDHVMEKLDAAKRTTSKGVEYWRARDIQEVLGYSKWENFRAAIERAVASCRSGGIDTRKHFLGTRKMVPVGSGAKVEVEDVYLDRYGCYLVAMNGEASKPEIASAQQYFAVQTRAHELDRAELNTRERVRLRDRLAQATKHLHSAAKQAGVRNYAYFHTAGYMGLYEMGLAEIKRRKGVGDKENLYDRAGRLELSANEFKATLTEKSIVTKGITGQEAAEHEHRRVGSVVRKTIHQEVGVYPEDLPIEPPLKQIAKPKKPKALTGGQSGSVQ